MLNGTEPLFQFTVLNPTYTASTSGFDELFEEGATLAAELRLPTNFFDLPGHQLFGGTWSSRTYVSLDQDQRIDLPAPNIAINRHEGSWSLYWNFDQYLVASHGTPGAGWGIFGRAGVAEDETNPLETFLSFGVGGTSPIPCRHKDGWGVGWYYVEESDQLGPVATALLQPGNGQGVELFYNIAVTPYFSPTTDLQIIEPGFGDFDTVVVPGIRGKLTL